jgi:hypothetical protein
VAALELTASRHLSLPFGTSLFAVARKHGYFTPHLSIVIPLYNAAATLPALHEEIAALQVNGGHELIIVNDGLFMIEKNMPDGGTLAAGSPISSRISWWKNREDSICAASVA